MQTHEVNYADISGEITIKFSAGKTLNDFCSRHIATYNTNRFDAFAIRVFLGNETVMTVFAKEKTSGPTDEVIPVKKFKMNSVPLQELLAFCESINFTVSSDRQMMEKMEVTNR